MQLTVTTIIYGLPTGQRFVPVHLTLPSATLSLQDLIAHKVQQEVLEYVAQRRANLSGEYLTPEELLQASPPVPGAVADEVARAQQAFVARAYMIVVDNRRVVDPQEMITLRPDTQVEFIKILPLVGG